MTLFSGSAPIPGRRFGHDLRPWQRALPLRWLRLLRLGMG
jgi:hypothetical protein